MDTYYNPPNVLSEQIQMNEPMTLPMEGEIYNGPYYEPNYEPNVIEAPILDDSPAPSMPTPAFPSLGNNTRRDTQVQQANYTETVSGVVQNLTRQATSSQPAQQIQSPPTVQQAQHPASQATQPIAILKAELQRPQTVTGQPPARRLPAAPTTKKPEPLKLTASSQSDQNGVVNSTAPNLNWEQMGMQRPKQAKKRATATIRKK